MLLAAALLLLTAPARAEQDRTLTVVTWGGTYEQSQRAAYFEPFEALTGVEVETVRYDGSLQALRDHLADGETRWDVIDLIRADAVRACDAGLLEKIDPAILEPAPDGTPARADFIEVAIRPCSITQLVFSTVIAYDNRAFPGEKPRRVEDFFNTERFPGKRALRKAPVALFEWALMAYGVPRQQLYELLSTQRGFDLALAKLEEIRDELVWWQGGQEPVDLLKQGKVAMASGYNGRFFHARAVEGAPISVIWDGQLLDYNAWAIPKGADDGDLARRFIGFATRTARLADQANRISYGPARKSAQRRVGLHVTAGVPMRPYLPTAERHMETAIPRDHTWYAQTVDLRQRRFRQWLSDDAGDTEGEAGREPAGKPAGD
ncbi:ABC transporter substrate-binding protein [Rhodovibrio sodomensis]|uniref:ABC transporter substrate-binding protein n=1 Tax=Rhodovibrio sodomensis TaxID=1088 RepID=UPI0019038B39|nr:ABC transporter substrate-binding protein [Rhodovibrio sodomensis]